MGGDAVGRLGAMGGHAVGLAVVVGAGGGAHHRHAGAGAAAGRGRGLELVGTARQHRQLRRVVGAFPHGGSPHGGGGERAGFTDIFARRARDIGHAMGGIDGGRWRGLVLAVVVVLATKNAVRRRGQRQQVHEVRRAKNAVVIGNIGCRVAGDRIGPRGDLHQFEQCLAGGGGKHGAFAAAEAGGIARRFGGVLGVIGAFWLRTGIGAEHRHQQPQPADAKPADEGAAAPDLRYRRGGGFHAVACGGGIGGGDSGCSGCGGGIGGGSESSGCGSGRTGGRYWLAGERRRVGEAGGGGRRDGRRAHADCRGWRCGGGSGGGRRLGAGFRRPGRITHGGRSRAAPPWSAGKR